MFSCYNVKGAVTMDQSNEYINPSEYQVGNTRYQVTPVFGDDSKAEDITEKIKRLILNDQGNKSAS